MSSSKCTTVREEIAWGKPLTPEAQAHILSCQSCALLALEFSNLDAMLGANLTAEIPDDFVDRVMNQINRDATSALSTGDWASALGTRVSALLQLRPVQVTVAYLGFIFTLGNVARFIIAILLPGPA